jgi:hypothetical protein
MSKFLKWLLVFLKWLGVGLFILGLSVMVMLSLNRILPVGWKLTVEIMLGLAALILSLTFTFLPWLRIKFGGITAGQKAWVNLGSVVVLAAVMFGLACLKWIAIDGLYCTKTGLETLAIDIFVGVMANQATFLASSKPSDVITAQIARDNAAG